MNDIGNLGSAITATNQRNPNLSTSDVSSLGQADFLELLTAQMRLQDPFEPVQNEQMVAQMAQFSAQTGAPPSGSGTQANA